MNKSDIISFFDARAAGWDADTVKNRQIIATILDHAQVGEGSQVLDVACGTGVLFEDYLERGACVTAVDISAEMVKIARQKYPQVEVLCGDVEALELGKTFDCVVVYNAFPHFPQPEKLIQKLSTLLKPGGTLTVAHGASRAVIDHHHEGHASKVSVGLMHEDVLEELFAKYLTVTVKISNDHMYQVTGRKD